MMIISKYKDYYDHYQGIFGMDKSKVYTRKKVVGLKDFGVSDTEETPLVFYICGVQYIMYEHSGKLYHTPAELMVLDNKLKGKSIWRQSLLTNYWFKSNKKTIKDYQDYFDDNNNT